jgi:hypothetical protein
VVGSAIKLMDFILDEKEKKESNPNPNLFSFVCGLLPNSYVLIELYIRRSSTL